MTAPALTEAQYAQTALRRVLGEFPSGVVAVAAQGPRGPVGLVAGSFTSVSLDPPLVSVNIAHSSTTLPHLRALEHWGVSVLAQRQRDVADLLRRPAACRFDGLDWTATDHGAVHLANSAVRFTTRLQKLIPAGDHDIALLAVDDHLTDTGTEPLIFHRSRFRRLQEHS